MVPMDMAKVLPRNVRAVNSAINGAAAEWRVDGVPGLLLDVSSKRAAWRLRFRPRPGANKTTHTIGDARVIELSAAIEKARALVSELQLKGTDPRATRNPTGATFDATYSLWLDRYAKVHKESWYADEKLYIRHVKERIGHDIVREIDRPRVIQVLDDIAAKATPLQANRCQSLISAILSWALDEGYTNSHPALRIRRRGEETSRELVMNDAQLKAFWTGIEGLLPNATTAIKLLLLTGQRLSEVVEAERRELQLDGDDPAWTIPPRHGNFKNGLTHIVPLTPMTVALFRAALVAGKDNPFVFPARRLEPAALDGNQVSRQCKEVFRAIEVGQMRLHDLRHQTATGMAKCGVPLDVRERVQNQITGRKGSIGSRYDQYEYLSEMRRSLSLWEARLLATVSGAPPPSERY